MNKKTSTEAERRKGIPVYSGFIKYFPRAILEVARLSKIANDQHNPGTELHWDRNKSGDELDSLCRHMIDDIFDDLDTDDVLHLTKVAWRGMANLEKKLEELNKRNNGK